MKNGERVTMRCLSCFMVEMFGYDSLNTNQGPLRRTLASGVKNCLGSVHPREGIDDLCGSTGHFFQPPINT